MGKNSMGKNILKELQTLSFLAKIMVFLGKDGRILALLITNQISMLLLIMKVLMYMILRYTKFPMVVQKTHFLSLGLENIFLVKRISSSIEWFVMMK